MILRCYPTASAILRTHTKSCLLCFFFPLFNSQNFLFTRLCSFFTRLGEPELCSAHLVGLKCARRTRARARRALALGARRRSQAIFCGGGKNGLVHCWRMRAIPMGIRARLHITATFERNLPLYSRILRHVGRWLGMVNEPSMVR